MTPVPVGQFDHYAKYLPPAWLFSDTSLTDPNLKFRSHAVIPEEIPAHFFAGREADAWDALMGVCVDCPATDYQMNFARMYFLRSGHYQHWTHNKTETYEQMVGDECCGGING